ARARHDAGTEGDVAAPARGGAERAGRLRRRPRTRRLRPRATRTTRPVPVGPGPTAYAAGHGQGPAGAGRGVDGVPAARLPATGAGPRGLRRPLLGRLLGLRRAVPPAGRAVPERASDLPRRRGHRERGREWTPDPGAGRSGRGV